MAADEKYLIDISLKVTNSDEMKRMVAELKRAGAATGDFARKAKTATVAADKYGRSNKRLGNIAQNVGFQIQDVIVQVSSGTSVFRSLAQQLPQLTVGFGAVGAGVGVVGAIIPALIAYFQEAEKETKDFEGALNDLNKALSNLNREVGSVDLSGWREEFNQAGEAAQRGLQDRLEQTVRRSQAELRRLSASLDDIGRATEESFEQRGVVGKAAEERLKALRREQEEWAAAIGLTAQEGDKLAASLEQTRAGGSEEAVRESIRLLEQSEATVGRLPEDLSKLLEQLYAIEGGWADINTLTQAAAEAAQGYGVVLSDVEPGGQERSGAGGGRRGGGGSRGPTLSRVTVDPDAVRQAAEQTRVLEGILQGIEDYQQRGVELWAVYNSELYEYANALNEANEARQRGILSEEKYQKEAEKISESYRKATEGLTLGEEAIELFDSSFNTMLDGVLMGTQSISDGFRDMARVIIAQLLKIAAYRAIAGIFGNDAFGGMFAPTPNAKGNIFSNGNVVPFAKGGVVNRPTLFPMANGTGLMGEAGPEAVMPLRRDSRGRLGVAGGGTSVTVNNMAPGVQVQTRQTDQGLTLDLVMRSIANAVQEGGNDVADSLERSYGLGRGRVVY